MCDFYSTVLCSYPRFCRLRGETSQTCSHFVLFRIWARFMKRVGSEAAVQYGESLPTSSTATCQHQRGRFLGFDPLPSTPTGATVFKEAGHSWEQTFVVMDPSDAEARRAGRAAIGRELGARTKIWALLLTHTLLTGACLACSIYILQRPSTTVSTAHPSATTGPRGLCKEDARHFNPFITGVWLCVSRVTWSENGPPFVFTSNLPNAGLYQS